MLPGERKKKVPSPGWPWENPKESGHHHSEVVSFYLCVQQVLLLLLLLLLLLFPFLLHLYVFLLFLPPSEKLFPAAAVQLGASDGAAFDIGWRGYWREKTSRLPRVTQADPFFFCQTGTGVIWLEMSRSGQSFHTPSMETKKKKKKRNMRINKQTKESPSGRSTLSFVGWPAHVYGRKKKGIVLGGRRPEEEEKSFRYTYNL